MTASRRIKSNNATDRLREGMPFIDHAGRPASSGSGGTASAKPGGTVTLSFAHDPAGRLLSVSSPLFSQRVWFGEAPPSIGGQARWSGSPCADSTATAMPGGGADTRRLRYSFDTLDRLTSAVDVDGREAFSETREFDINGNTVSLDRRVGGTALQRFDAAYDGNALVSLNDDSDGALPTGTSSFPPGYYPPGSFTRDALGRVTRDSTHSVVSVVYDPRCGLPASVRTASGQRVVSAYLPDGALLSRELLTPRVTVTTTVNAKGDTIVRTRRDNIRDTEARYGAFTRRRDTKGAVTWRLDHDAGAAIVDAGGAVTHLFHIRDRLGSTRVVFGMDGAPLQSVGYFPDGAPVILGGSARLTDRLREGMPFIDHAGLGAYDNRARWLDAVGGSFWQPDPKAGEYPGFSPYANRGCNPTRFLDPSGEEIVILHYDKRYRLAMNDGLFQGFDEDGEAYNNQDDRDTFIKSVLGAITKIAKGKYGAELVQYLMGAKETVTITESNKNSYTPNGRVVNWNPMEKNGGPSIETDGVCYTTERPEFIGLAHEFGHAGDHINGTFNSRVWKTLDGNKITYSERNAMTVENFIRIENGKNPRTHYLMMNYYTSPDKRSHINKIPGNTSFALTIIIRMVMRMTMFNKK